MKRNLQREGEHWELLHSWCCESATASNRHQRSAYVVNAGLASPLPLADLTGSDIFIV
jgi:hypothetical protein